MSRRGFTGPKLPQVLLDKVQDGGVSKRGRNDYGRKDRRKAERQQKKGTRAQPTAPQRMRKIDQRAAAYMDLAEDEDENEDEDEDHGDQSEEEPPPPARVRLEKDAKPTKSILKKPSPPSPSPSPEESEVEREESSESDAPAPAKKGRASSPSISRAGARAGLDDDDAEIAALEKRLGIKSKKSSGVDDDELNWLVNGSDSVGDNGAGKRKRPEDEQWLKDKRRRAGAKAEPVKPEESDDNDDDVLDESGASEEDNDNEGDEGDKYENPFSEDEVDSDDDFGGFDSEDNEAAPAPPKRERENPYVAPVPKNAAPAGKYIPPSLRKAAASDEEMLKQLRRQLQGLLNRLSEANMLSILQSVEEIYEKNARQHVTSTMVDLLYGLIADPSTLNDTFLILHAGFATALYKVIGTDFGAQLLEQTVNGIDKSRSEGADDGKQTLNLIGFLSNLYTLQMTGSAIIFDYIRIFLEELSENNTELLLRMIRTSGMQLRSDDPSALKDIVLLLQRAAAQVGEDKLSVRTKFMIETINNLKNNRMKTGVAASAITTEHMTRMKRTLGTLNTRAVRATEPLRISLADIRDSEKKGKWWLVGASYHDPSKLASGLASSSTKDKASNDDLDAGYESETPGNVSLTKLAKSQGMNTDIRRAVFISILSASDFKDAHIRLLKLHLKNKQQLEIPRVLLHCAGAEKVYNPYYTFIARKLCSDRKIRKAFQFALWDIFRRMGEQGDAEDELDEQEAAQMTTIKVINLAKLYGTLVADGGLSIAALRTLNFAYLQPKTRMFAEVLLTTLLLQAHKKASGKGEKKAVEAEFEVVVKEALTQAATASGLVQGLRYFVESFVAEAEIANGKKERKIVKNGCEHAVQALAEAAAKQPAVLMSDDEGMSD